MKKGGRAHHAAEKPKPEQEEQEEMEFALPERPLKPSQCRTYMRRTLAAQFPYILRGLVQGARKGSCQHVKLATELLQSTQPREAKKRGTVERLLDEWGVE